MHVKCYVNIIRRNYCVLQLSSQNESLSIFTYFGTFRDTLEMFFLFSAYFALFWIIFFLAWRAAKPPIGGGGGNLQNLQ